MIIGTRTDKLYQVSTEYQDYAISTALSSASQLFDNLDVEQQKAISHSFTLSGNVELSDVSSYQAQNSNYTYTLLDPYGSKSTDTIKVWGDYIKDILKEIDDDVRRRNYNIIPLDFAILMMVVASLSSMITLEQCDLALVPTYQARFSALAGSHVSQKQANLLKQDTVLFSWFVVRYFLGGNSQKEDVARALYSALRCGLLHNMTIGQVFGNRLNSNRYTITLCSRNPDESSGKWYEEICSDSTNCTFYFKEFYAVVVSVAKNLFLLDSEDPQIVRFQNNARTVLSGHVPVKLLKAVLKK